VWCTTKKYLMIFVVHFYWIVGTSVYCPTCDVMCVLKTHFVPSAKMSMIVFVEPHFREVSVLL